MSALILVIDDDLIVRKTVTRILEDENYRVLAVENGDQGLAAFRKVQPDLVLTDIIMPEKEGLETIITIRLEHPSAKIIAMSGGGRIQNSDFLKMAKAFGANETLSKPFGPEELLELVGRCLTQA